MIFKKIDGTEYLNNLQSLLEEILIIKDGMEKLKVGILKLVLTHIEKVILMNYLMRQLLMI
jgi:hypothetical protein